MLIWHYIVKAIGKKKSWTLYSLISLFVFALFLLCSEGSFTLLIISSICLAIPAGGAYINDVFLSDCIDYDEFLTGQRNEGIYTMFTSFIPKFVSIFAQSIPLTILGIIGFISSHHGANLVQPKGIVEFVRFYFIGVPILLSFISFCCKLRFPIENEDLMQDLRSSIQLQKEKVPEFKKRLDFYKIKDPIMKNYSYQIFLKTPEHYDTKTVADHFNDYTYFNMLFRGEYTEMKTKIFTQIIILFLISSIFLFLVFITFSYLQIRSLSFIPILCLLILSISIFLLVLNILRLNIINRVITGEDKIDKDFLRLLMIGYKVEINEDKNPLLTECSACWDKCCNKPPRREDKID